jgi:hypothetical protein
VKSATAIKKEPQHTNGRNLEIADMYTKPLLIDINMVYNLYVIYKSLGGEGGGVRWMDTCKAWIAQIVYYKV